MRAPLCLSVALLPSACVSNDGPTETYAFVRTWDCGPARPTLTNSTYYNRPSRYPIADMARDGMDYTLRFASGCLMALAAVTETGLTRVLGNSGAQLNCHRVV